MKKKKGTLVSGIVGGLLLGLLLGAALGVLGAPRSGRKTRKQILRQARDIRNRANDTLSDVRERVGT